MTTFARLRRDPTKGKKEFSKHHGFTVIELMIVVAVLAIITSLALPSYRALIEKRQVTSGAEQLSAFLSAVQIEAVKRSENITVSYAMDDAQNWCIGIVSGAEPCNCADTNPESADCRIDGQIRIIDENSVNHPEVMSDMPGDGSFVFDPARGLVFDDDSFADYDTAEIQLLSSSDSYALNVQVSQVGRIRICSDSPDKKVPGYDLCAD